MSLRDTDIEKLLKQAKPGLLSRGSSKAQFELGLRYEKGQGIAKDEKVAAEFYSQAVAQNNADAQCNLGMMYLEGRGITKDENRAYALLQQAVGQGQAQAECNLGVLYEEGRSWLDQNDKRAFELYKQSAEKLNPKALFRLGLMYEYGRGVDKDQGKANECYRWALNRGYATARCKIGWDSRTMSYADVERVYSEMTRHAAEEGYDISGEWKIEKEENARKALLVSSPEDKPQSENQVQGLFDLLSSDRKLQDDKQLSENQRVPGPFDFLGLLDQSQPSSAVEVEAQSKPIPQPSAAVVVETQAQPIPEPSAAAEVKITQEHIEFMATFQHSGLKPEAILEMQKQLATLSLSSEEMKEFLTWKKEFSEQMAKMQSDLAGTNKSLSRDPQALSEQAFIDQNSKLKNYQFRVEQELSCFILCYFIAPVGIFKLEDNKKGSAISMIGSTPVVGSFLKVLTTPLAMANKKYRFFQMNHPKELFRGVEHIGQVCRDFARTITVIQAKTVEQQNFVKYQGLAKVKGYFQMVKETLDNQWNDLATSDKTGVTLGAEEKMAVLDVAYLLQQVLSGTAKPKKDQDLAPQFVEIVTGDVYQAPALNLAALQVNTVNAGANIVAAAAKPSMPAPFLNNSLPANNSALNSAMSLDAMQRMLENQAKAHEEELRKQKEEFERHKKEQEEAFRRHQEELEAAKEELKKQKDQASAAEELVRQVSDRLARTEEDTAKLKKKLGPEHDASGGSQSLAQLDPRHEAGVSQHSETAQILSEQGEQLRVVFSALQALQEAHNGTAAAVQDMQRKAGVNSGKTDRRRLELVQYNDDLERKKRDEAERLAAQKKAEKQQQVLSGFV